MMSDADDAIGYAAAVDAYRQAGWIGVLPMQRGAKVWPPAIPCDEHRPKTRSSCPNCISYTGYAGIDPSGADLAAWSESYRDGNLCLRMPNNTQIAVVGIDVDNYGAKTGGATFIEAQRRWGPLPPAPRSTSREGNPMSGIRLFRVSPGTKLSTKIAFPELGLGDIEVCQFHHRYVIAWPSLHPEGRQYWWRNNDDQLIGIPVVDELPWLPPRWIDGLRVEHESNLANTPADILAVLTEGQPSIPVQDRLNQAIKELNLPGTSRHDTALKHTMALMRMGKSGEPGVKYSLQLLCEVFVAVAAADGSRTPDVARDEFVRMIDNDNARRELANDGITDWMRAFVVEGAPAGVSDAISLDGGSDREQPTNDFAPPTQAEGAKTGDYLDTAGSSVSSHGSAPRSALEAIERGFWDSRESLRMIYQTSMASMCPPWAVLGICAARALAQVRPHITLPPLIGRRGSLNFFAAIVSGPAGGKTTSAEVAELLVPGHILTCHQGTGEGILATFGRAADPSDPNSLPEFEAVMLDVDEIDSLMGISGRAGSTTMPLLRSAFSGATLAFSYANRDKRRYIRKHTYRMTAIVGMQPKRAGAILAESDGGTPQRFMWFPATDSRVRRERPWPTGPLSLPRPGEWMYPMEIRVPQCAEDLILDEHVKRQQGGQDALDGHALFCREKFAYALTVLDGRIHMTEEDWELSGITAEVSLYTRAMVVQELKEAARIEALDRGDIRGIELAAADDSKQYEEAERVRHSLRWALSKIESAGPSGISNRDLVQSSDSRRTRRWLQSALTIGQSNGLIRQLEGTTTWVKI